MLDKILFPRLARKDISSRTITTKQAYTFILTEKMKSIKIGVVDFNNSK